MPQCRSVCVIHRPEPVRDHREVGEMNPNVRSQPAYNTESIVVGKRNEIIIPEILRWSGSKEQIQQWGRRKEIIYRSLCKKNGIPILKGIK